MPEKSALESDILYTSFGCRYLSLVNKIASRFYITRLRRSGFIFSLIPHSAFRLLLTVLWLLTSDF